MPGLRGCTATGKSAGGVPEMVRTGGHATPWRWQPGRVVPRSRRIVLIYGLPGGHPETTGADAGGQVTGVPAWNLDRLRAYGVDEARPVPTESPRMTISLDRLYQCARGPIPPRARARPGGCPTVYSGARPSPRPSSGGEGPASGVGRSHRRRALPGRDQGHRNLQYLTHPQGGAGGRLPSPMPATAPLQPSGAWFVPAIADTRGGRSFPNRSLRPGPAPEGPRASERNPDEPVPRDRPGSARGAEADRRGDRRLRADARRQRAVVEPGPLPHLLAPAAGPDPPHQPARTARGGPRPSGSRSWRWWPTASAAARRATRRAASRSRGSPTT